jgi:hypothetical protein
MMVELPAHYGDELILLHMAKTQPSLFLYHLLCILASRYTLSFAPTFLLLYVDVLQLIFL